MKIIRINKDGSMNELNIKIPKNPNNVLNKNKNSCGTDDLKLSTYLARGLIDEFKLPHEIKKLKALDLGGLKGKLELDALRIAQKANQLTTDEKKVLYNMLEGDIKYPVPVKYLNTLAEEARKNIDDVGQMYVQTGLITEETFLIDSSQLISLWLINFAS